MLSTSVYSPASRPNDTQRADVDAPAGQVQVVAHVDALDPSPDDVVGQRRHRDDAVDDALEGDRGAGDTRSRNDLGRSLFQPERLELVDVGVEFVGRAVYGVRLPDRWRCSRRIRPVSRMLTKVSLSVTPSERGCRVIDRTGGNLPTTVKNDTGAMLPTPVVELVLTQAMARGSTLPMRSL